MVDMVDNKCPICGTLGRVWHKNPQTFRCPNCSSIYSEFGMIIEIENENMNMWS